MSDLLKREDIPFELAMAMTEKALEAGKQLVCAGDMEDPPPGALEFVKKFDEACKKSLETGTCWGCDRIVPGWPTDPVFEDGWGTIHMQNGEHPDAYECPHCTGPALDDNNFGIMTVGDDGIVEMTREFDATQEPE